MAWIQPTFRLGHCDSTTSEVCASCFVVRDPHGILNNARGFRYIYRIIFGCDGNFSLQKKAKRDDRRDASLAMGEGFFIYPEKMLPLLEKKWVKEIIVSVASYVKFLHTDLYPTRLRHVTASELGSTNASPSSAS